MKFDSEEEASTCRKGMLRELPPHPVSPERLLTAIQEGLNDQQGATLICARAKSLDDLYQLDRTPAALRAKSVRDPHLG
jgi:hypothetical protein